jgi:hypothetical protein
VGQVGEVREDAKLPSKIDIGLQAAISPVRVIAQG